MHSLFSDREFLSRMFRLASPIMLQQFIFSSLGMVDSMMVGQLGETAVAAVGVANQVFFLVTLLFFGITSGASIFTAQYWGQEDIPRIRKTLGLSLLMCLGGGMVFSLVALLLPVQVMGVYTKDLQVIEAGARYLQIMAISYLFTALTYSYSAALRSVENVRLPMLVSLISLSLNTLLNYGLIFGRLGLPEMGITGAALGTATARLLEIIILSGIIYRRDLPVAVRLHDLGNFQLLNLERFFRTTIPVVVTEIVWSFGMTAYSVVYARIGTEEIAAYNIALTLNRLIFVVLIGLGNACAIMIGNRIGAGERDLVEEYSRKFLILGSGIAVLLAGLLIILIGPVVSLYQVSPATLDYARRILLLMSFSLPIRNLNLLILIGMLRAGGDTRYAFFIDAGVVWTIGVPMAVAGAFLLKLPVHLVYLMALSEEVVKCGLGLYRIFSRRWIHSLTGAA